ncbi:MAG: hypothetical protein JXP73_09490 [Deltaproteobacteria bacterium]|nr:hypothetical protein [Deltaproteobacteria bacterium]
MIRPAPLALLFLAFSAQAEESHAFRQALGDAEIDWSAGTVRARAGAAGDIRMPGPNAARPGAERRARAAAKEKLRAALRDLGRGARLDVESALARASLSRIEYQSNGGVVLWLVARFSDLAPAKAAAVSLRVASMPFSLAPTVVAGGKTARLGMATYRPAASCPKDAVAARRDGQGRLALPERDARLVDSLAGAAVVIYLDRPQP